MKATFLVGILASALAVAETSVWGASVHVDVTIDASQPGPEIPADFAGLSYETQRELVDKTGTYYFSPQNAPLVRMFQTLGIKNLRVGGASVDNAKTPVPTEADIDALFQFARAADAKIIYSFRLRKGNPANSALQAKYIADNYATDLACFSIGNEPDMYDHTYETYIHEWLPIYSAINQAVPHAVYCGPSFASANHPWAADFARDYFPGGKILYITQHHYEGGDGEKVTDPVKGRSFMLSPKWHELDQAYYDKLVPPLKEIGAPFRLEEANNFYHGGAQDVSDTFASALWGMDYLHWWAEHGSRGINFHTGDTVAAYAGMKISKYASFTSTKDGYFARPLGYGIKLFNLGSHGKPVPSTMSPEEAGKDINVVSYAVLGDDGSLYVTLINKEHGPQGRDADVTIMAGSSDYSKGQSISLVSPNDDDSAKDGLILGGNPIKEDGSWQETWTDLNPPSEGHLQVKVPACSAILIRLSPK